MKKFFKEFLKCFYPPLFVFLILNMLIGGHFRVYITWPDYDIPVHFFGGVSMAITGYLLLKLCEKYKWIELKNKLIFLFLIVCYVTLTATLWEFYEFLMDHFFGTFNQLSIADTMGDMLFGMVGSVVGGAGMIWKKKK